MSPPLFVCVCVCVCVCVSVSPATRGPRVDERLQRCWGLGWGLGGQLRWWLKAGLSEGYWHRVSLPPELRPGLRWVGSLTLGSPADRSEHADLPLPAGRRSHGCEQLRVGVCPSPRHPARAAGGTCRSPSRPLCVASAHLACRLPLGFIIPLWEEYVGQYMGGGSFSSSHCLLGLTRSSSRAGCRLCPAGSDFLRTAQQG